MIQEEKRKRGVERGEKRRGEKRRVVFRRLGYEIEVKGSRSQMVNSQNY